MNMPKEILNSTHIQICVVCARRYSVSRCPIFVEHLRYKVELILEKLMLFHDADLVL
jgi:hypothetical protein